MIHRFQPGDRVIAAKASHPWIGLVLQASPGDRPLLTVHRLGLDPDDKGRIMPCTAVQPWKLYAVPTRKPPTQPTKPTKPPTRTKPPTPTKPPGRGAANLFKR